MIQFTFNLNILASLSILSINSHPGPHALMLFPCRARGLDISSSGMCGVRLQGVHISASAWRWFWRRICWAAVRPCWTASRSKSRLSGLWRWSPGRLNTSTLKAHPYLPTVGTNYGCNYCIIRDYSIYNI